MAQLTDGCVCSSVYFNVATDCIYNKQRQISYGNVHQL